MKYVKKKIMNIFSNFLRNSLSNTKWKYNLMQKKESL